MSDEDILFTGDVRGSAQGALFNPKVRALAFDSLIEISAAEISLGSLIIGETVEKVKGHSTFGLAALLDVLGLRTDNTDYVFSCIEEYWNFLGVSPDYNTRQSVETIFLVLYLFFSLITAENTAVVMEMKSSLQDLSERDMLQLMIIESLLLAPIFANAFSSKSDIECDLKGHKINLKTIHDSFFNSIGSAGGLAEV